MIEREHSFKNMKAKPAKIKHWISTTKSLLLIVLIIVLFLTIDIISTDAHQRYYLKLAVFILALLAGILNLVLAYRYERDSIMKKMLAFAAGVMGIIAYAVFFRA